MTVIDRGLVSDWSPIFVELLRSPWGKVAHRVEQYLSYREPDGVSTLLALAIEGARIEAENADRAEVAARIHDSVVGSGLATRDFVRQRCVTQVPKSEPSNGYRNLTLTTCV